MSKPATVKFFGQVLFERDLDGAINEAAEKARASLPADASEKIVADRAAVIMQFHLGLLDMPSFRIH